MVQRLSFVLTLEKLKKELSEHDFLEKQKWSAGYSFDLDRDLQKLRDKLALAEERWVNEIAPQLLAKAELKEDIKVVEVRLADISADAARKLAQRLAENPQAQVTVFYQQKNRLNYILTKGSAVPVSCRERIAVLNKELNGHGGGNDNMAQGSSEQIT